MRATQFRLPRHLWIRLAWLVGMPLLVHGCADRPPTEPSGEDPSLEPACRLCPLMVDASPLNAARVHPDSADVPVFLAEFRIRGERGDSVTLVLEAAEGILEAIGPAQRISVEIDGATTEHTLHELLAGVVVYEFGGRETIDVHYSMNRAVSRRIEGAITVTQDPGRAGILLARTPWADLTRPRILLQELGSGCSGEITAASGTICGITVTVTPFAVAEIGGATFQSGSGNGASSPINISLNPANSVMADTATGALIFTRRTVTVTIVDPDFGGNSAVAHNASGAIVASASFAGDNMPGVPSSEMAALAADEIASVNLTPAPEDYVAYTVTIGVVTDTCRVFDDPEEVDDSLVLDPEVQSMLKQLTELSNWDEEIASRMERGGFIVEDDGVVRFIERQYAAGEGPELCLTIGDTQQLIDLAQQHFNEEITILAQIHTHPAHGERVANPGNCRQPRPLVDGTIVIETVVADSLEFADEPSKQDLKNWEEGLAPWPGYVLDPEALHRFVAAQGAGNPDPLDPESETFDVNRGANACISVQDS